MFKALFYLLIHRTLLKELIMERARRDLESKGKNFDVYYWQYHNSRGINEKNLRKIDCPIYYKTSRFFDIE
jgi:hypothetical protein